MINMAHRVCPMRQVTDSVPFCKFVYNNVPCYLTLPACRLLLKWGSSWTKTTSIWPQTHSCWMMIWGNLLFSVIFVELTGLKMLTSFFKVFLPLAKILDVVIHGSMFEWVLYITLVCYWTKMVFQLQYSFLNWRYRYCNTGDRSFRSWTPCIFVGIFVCTISTPASKVRHLLELKSLVPRLIIHKVEKRCGSTLLRIQVGWCWKIRFKQQDSRTCQILSIICFHDGLHIG